MQRFLFVAFVIAACASDSGPGTNAGGSNGSGSGSGSGSASCAQSVIQPPTTAVCALATKTCIAACADTDEACPDNCFAMDPSADDCYECIDDAFLSCVNAAGCQADFDALECCAASCSDPDSDDCYTVTCAAQNTAYENCADTHGDNCDDAVCFKTM